MFTGIIAEIGKVKRLSRKKDGGAELVVGCSHVGTDMRVGDSVAVNGVCLSIVDKNGSLIFDVVGNTLKNTNLKRLRAGDRVNLENALKLGDTLSGHMVSGHIDCERTVRGSRKASSGWILDINISTEDSVYIVPKGSIAVDGTSLTVGEIHNGYFRIFLIPHTLDNTVLKDRKTGDMVNLEFDIMAKYSDRKGVGITLGMLMDNGFF